MHTSEPSASVQSDAGRSGVRGCIVSHTLALLSYTAKASGRKERRKSVEEEKERKEEEEKERKKVRGKGSKREWREMKEGMRERKSMGRK